MTSSQTRREVIREWSGWHLLRAFTAVPNSLRASSEQQPWVLPIPAVIPDEHSTLITLYYGPHDGLEITISAPKPLLVREDSLTIYVRTDRRTSEGRLIYDFDQQATDNTRKRWKEVYDSE